MLGLRYDRRCGRLRVSVLVFECVPSVPSPPTGPPSGDRSPAARPEQPAFRGTERYDVIERLGSGGMGTVYAVRDRLTGAKVALKHLHQQRPDSLALFKREFRNFQGVQHRNLISLGELRAEDGEWFFTMELLTGKSFNQFVRAGAHALDLPVQRSSTFLARGVTMPSQLFNGMTRRVGVSEQPRSRRRCFHEGRLRDALAQLACGLAVLHRANKVHSDVKPSNIVIESSGRLVLLDFGIAVDIDERHHRLGRRVLGSAPYMAPEQLDPEATTPASDCYAVGILTYEALTGQRPFVGATALEILEHKRTREPRPPSRIAAGIPSDLERLCLDLLAVDPSARPSATDILRRLNAWDALAELDSDTLDDLNAEEVFVGRKRELEILLGASRPPIESRIVAVSGQSGVGKSALLERFRLRLADTLVLHGRCHERESVPFKGIDSVIQKLLDHLQRLPPTELEDLIPKNVARIADIFPRFGLLFDVESLTDEPAATPFDLRQEAFAQLRALLTRLARRTPVVVTIDDMQWADSDTWALLGHLMRKPHPPSLLMVLAMRAAAVQDDAGDGAEDELAELDQLGDVERVHLSPLTTDESRALAVHLLSGVGRQDEPLAVEIASESEGHPLFIREIIRYAGEHLVLDVRSDLLDEALQARFASLSPEAKRLLELLATAGIPMRHATMASAVEVDFDRYLRSVGQLRTGHLVQTTGVELDCTIALDHERIREAILGRLSPEDAQGLHLQLAEALERSNMAEKLPEVTAHHLSAGGQPEQASNYLLRAADQAMDSLAFDSASSLYRSALATGAFAEDAQQRIRLQFAEALVDSGRAREAGDAFLLVAGATEDGALRLRSLYRAAEQLLLSGDLVRGREVLRRVLSAIGVDLPTTRSGILWSLLVHRLWLRIRGLSWRERPAEEILENELTQVDILRSAGRALGLVEPIAASVLHSRSLLLALRVGEPVRVGWCLAFEATFGALKCCAKADEARAILKRAHDLGERTGDPGLQAWTIAQQGLVEYFDTRYHTAYDCLATATERFRRLSGQLWERITSQTMLLLTVRAMGRFRELAEMRERFLHEAIYRGDLYNQTTVRQSTCIVWLCSDDVERARRDLAESSWRADSYDLQLQHWYEIRAHAEIALYTADDRQEMNEAIAQVSRIEKSILTRVQGVRIESRFLRARLLLATEPDRIGPIVKQARRLEREPCTSGALSAAFLRAGLAADADEMRAHLSRAEAMASDAGADWMWHTARYWHGRSLEADGGVSLVDSSVTWMRTQGIDKPERMARLLIPIPERLLPD